MKLLDRLDELGKKDILKLVHFHLGSQITDIRYIKAGLEEIGRYYSELHRMGFPVSHVDVAADSAWTTTGPAPPARPA
jgi:arginine decarboxylase